jgi:misacylated tRNA(Ala) deacylase
MSELLFQKDSYLKEFKCSISEVNKTENAVVLDRTAFYPAGGGQPYDTGILEGESNVYTVERTKKIGDSVYHYINGRLPEPGQTCMGKIDWDRRYKLMRTHTAMHILCAVAWRDYKAKVTGGDMNCLSARMDFEFENFNRELVDEIEKKANEEIKCRRDIRVNFLEREEALKIPDLIKTKEDLLPRGIDKIRTVEIEGLDLQADGGTHVKNTAEVGSIKVVRFKSKGRINKRIYVEIED